MGWNQITGSKTRLQIGIQPNLGLDSDALNSVMRILNIILADEAVLALKTHTAQWHVHGANFLELRTQFAKQYHQLNLISDENADRVRMLGGVTISSFKEILEYTRLVELPGEVAGIISLLADHEAIIRFLREDVRKCQDEYEDQGTSALLVRTICSHEKMAWILRSYIEPEIGRDD